MTPDAAMTPDPPETPDLLALHALSVGFADGGAGVVPVLRDVSLRLRRGECLGLVGESGCGKSLTALAILGLLPPGGTYLAGRIELAGVGDLRTLPPRAWRRARGRRIAAVFQEPMSCLNPVLTIGFQIAEVLRLHRRLSRRAARRAARELLERVAMPDPEHRLKSYPHELSGGQQQRALIALALASEPELLLADEPTTALDVTVQAQILELLRSLRRELGLTMLLITHDLGVVAQCCERVAVMYAGQVVEEAPAATLFDSPAHPYTRALLAAVPRLSLGGDAPTRGIPGRVPELGALPDGCSFHPRCDRVFGPCRRHSPPLFELAPGQRARCFLHGDAASVGAAP
ncbi:MAG TPA: ABC transporter ATP-binding protein [Thermoanaerobaculia bacterium]|jgi:oligopeptide/dipeptide ABC transporter ATP-binding protein